MSHRKFPAPWRVEPTEGGHFVVNDATGFSICYVYARKDEALRGSYMTHAEAVEIAEQIGGLTELTRGREAEARPMCNLYGMLFARGGSF
jgi:hypothetical protein